MPPPLPLRLPQADAHTPQRPLLQAHLPGLLVVAALFLHPPGGAETGKAGGRTGKLQTGPVICAAPKLELAGQAVSLLEEIACTRKVRGRPRGYRWRAEEACPNVVSSTYMFFFNLSHTRGRPKSGSPHTVVGEAVSMSSPLL